MDISYQRNITIQVVSQNKINVITFRSQDNLITYNKEADNDGYSHRVISKERSSQGWHDPEFICHSELEFVTHTRLTILYQR